MKGQAKGKKIPIIRALSYLIWKEIEKEDQRKRTTYLCLKGVYPR
jgi:hypothetical protein